MHLSVIGSGYVGTTIAACFAELGHEVTNIDIDEEIVETINSGRPPIHEDGLEDHQFILPSVVVRELVQEITPLALDL